jgi:hypothetical protein
VNKIAFAALLSASAMIASPAAAQQATTGTVDVKGVVASRCTVLDGGAEKTTFTGQIDLGRLDAADGTIRTDLNTSSTTNPAAAKKVVARVICTSSNATIGVSATKLAIAGAADAGIGYANSIDYVAALRVNTAASTVAEVKFDTGLNTAGTPVTALLGGRIAGGPNNNVEVNVSNLRTADGAVLNQGTYNSVISLSITPTL